MPMSCIVCEQLFAPARYADMGPRWAQRDDSTIMGILLLIHTPHANVGKQTNTHVTKVYAYMRSIIYSQCVCLYAKLPINAHIQWTVILTGQSLCLN